MTSIFSGFCLFLGTIGGMTYPAKAHDAIVLSDRIGTLIINTDGSLNIDLDYPVLKEHSHRIIPPDHSDIKYLIAQADQPQPGIKAILRRVLGNVTMQSDRSLIVSTTGSGFKQYQGLHSSMVIRPQDKKYHTILKLIGDISPGFTLPIIKYDEGLAY